MFHLLVHLITEVLLHMVGGAVTGDDTRRGNLSAEPTLRGLRVKYDDGPLSGTTGPTYPWEDVGFGSDSTDNLCWKVYDRDGRLAEHEGRPIRLVLAGEKVGNTARRAYLRRFKRLWKFGGLQFSDVYKSAASRRPSIRSILTFGVVAAVFVALFARIWILPEPEMTRHVQLTMTGIFLPGVLMFIVLPLWMFHRGRRAAGLINVAQASFTNTAVTARLLDGTEVRHAWSELSEVEGGHNLVRAAFNDSTILYFGDCPRTCAILGLAAREHVLGPSAIQEQGGWQSNKRAVLYAVLGLGLVAALVCAERRAGTPLRPMLTGPSLYLASMAGLLALILAIKWIEHMLARRAQRQKRAHLQRSQPLAR